jgi:phosphoribosylaminoimidazole carboxylase
MLAASASLLNIRVIILDNGEYSPAKQILAPPESALAHIDGSFTDPEKIRELASKVDVLTVEIEHVDVSTLDQVLSASQEKQLVVHPSPSTIAIIQDKFRQKEHLMSHSLPVAESIAVESTIESIQDAAEKLGLPLMLKSRTLAYDGRGNFVLCDLEDVQNAIDFLGNRPIYAEKWVLFTKEIAVMVVRTERGDVESYPVVETVHKDNICHLVFAPLRTRDPSIIQKAKDVAESAVKSFTGAGIFGVEMFLLEDGTAVLKYPSPLSLTKSRRYRDK